LHPDFLALCGYFCLQPIACERRDPESKGIVEGGVRYVKHNALAGRDDELLTFADYLDFAPRWRDSVANVRIHETTRERPLDRFQRERSLLRPLPSIPFDTDEIVPCIVSTHARVEFDGNRYSVPPSLHRRTVTLRADAAELRVLVEGQVVVRHQRLGALPPETRIATRHEWQLIDEVEQHIQELEKRIRLGIGQLADVRRLRSLPGADEVPDSTDVTRRFEQWRELLRDETAEGDAEDPPQAR